MEAKKSEGYKWKHKKKSSAQEERGKQRYNRRKSAPKDMTQIKMVDDQKVQEPSQEIDLKNKKEEVDLPPEELMKALELHESMEREEQISAEKEQEEEEEDGCWICTDPISVFALGKCNHRGLCSICALRRRILYNDRTCAFCKADLEFLVLTESSSNLFEEYTLNSLHLDASLPNVYVEDPKHLEKLLKFWELKCPSCKAKASSFVELQKHLGDVHQLSFCEVCLEDRKVFLQEQKLFSSTKDLKNHFANGDKDNLIKHEFCKFCKKHFYDTDRVYEHLQKVHFTCFLCEREGILYQYFKDYRLLETHFGEQHYLCEDENCLAKGFIAFKTALEMQFHDIREHIGSRGLSHKQTRNARQLKLGFTVRGQESEHKESKESKEEVLKPPPIVGQEYPSLEGESGAIPKPSLQTAATWGASKPPRIGNQFPPLPVSDTQFPSLSKKSQTGKSTQTSVWGTTVPVANTPSTSTTQPYLKKKKNKNKKVVLQSYGSLPINQ